MKKIEDLVELVNAGAHLDLSASRKKVPDLIALAQAASRSKSNIIIDGSKKVDDLIAIVKAGRGRVTIRFTGT
ncbi:hypothetical protein [Hansschlegelia zhihuaiae]|uniref:Uncharacterized protein n=1 Tax=Hansschlegelia zhihuaiae TaxID=405005 RepID=A0A4Q0MH52_9HYPH|nr:hypothetical protein [Hansschlegelia zhihuaiae]RXF72820.1 hypothetical protein EK403_13360 [Hansschlegelia zhihuaiae]